MISVIVPVYKAEKFLSRCIESILAQTYQDWELLLVDDGSPDKSGLLCDEYSKKDSRVQVFHKVNGGVSSARNLGLEMASGEWITFVDADDALDANAFTSCLSYFVDSDIIRFSMKKILEKDGSKTEDYSINALTKEDLLGAIAARQTLLSVWGGLYRKSIFDKNHLRFNTSLVCGEDWVMLIKLIIYSDRVSLFNRPFYLYTLYNQDSCTYQLNTKSAISSIKAAGIIKEALSNYKGDRYKKEMAIGKCKVVYDYVSHCVNYPNTISRHEFNQFVREGGDISIKEILRTNFPIRKMCLLLLHSNKLGKEIISHRLRKD